MKGVYVPKRVNEILKLMRKANEDIIDDITAQEEGFKDKSEFDSIHLLNEFINSFIDKYVKSEEEYRAEYKKSIFKFGYYSRDKRIQDIRKDLVKSYIRRTS